jgi:hypothetical protein
MFTTVSQIEGFWLPCGRSGLDRIGSEKAVVDLQIIACSWTDELLSMRCKRCRELSPNDSSWLLEDRNSKLRNYCNQIEDPHLRKLQQMASRIARIQPGRDDLDRVAKILTTKPSERFPLSKAALDILKPTIQMNPQAVRVDIDSVSFY